MTKPRITSSTPPPARLFPVLPKDVVAQLVDAPPLPELATAPEPAAVPEPPTAPQGPAIPEPFRIVLTVRRLSREQQRGLRLAGSIVGALLLIVGTVCVGLVVAGAPILPW